MPLGTRALWIDYANLLGGDRSSTNPALTAAEKIALANEIYDWLYLAGTPRVSYLSQAGFAHADGTTVVADSGLRLVAAGDYLMTTALTNIAEVFSVHFEGLAGADPGTIESVPQLEYLELGELLERRATLGSGTTQRYVHWRRLATTTAATPTAVGKWELMIAPAKSPTAGAGTWWFSVVCRRGLSTPDADLSTSAPLSGDSSVPDLLPHETYLGARLTAFEILLRTGADPQWAKRCVRNVPKYLMTSFMAARGLGDATGIGSGK